MNYFEYKIYDNVYNDIIIGKKTIEFRLLNEKSNSIKIGDQIKFIILNDENKYVLTEVINKYIYDDIDNLLSNKNVLKNNLLNYNKSELIEAFYNIFGKENVNNSKIVGIEFKVREFK